MLALRALELAGVNVALMEHDAPAAIDAGQVLVSEKSPAFVPVTATLVMVNVALPVFVRVALITALLAPTF
ncbi:MAG TPA: hypothetical protein VKJ01_16030 [Candidatus Solibacter sp.]|jgi:hypothetical protein|nr:hypothetical protein [Candidatus Solibacter sp.]